jgi:hypothetical protein
LETGFEHWVLRGFERCGNCERSGWLIMATIYVDPTRADDTGNGTSEATAKRTIRGARLIAVNNDTILVRSGYCHDALSGQFFTSAALNGVKISTYGTSSNEPIWDGLTYQNPGVAGWTHVSSGIWKKTFGAWYVRRLFVASRSTGQLTTDRVIGDAKKRATVTGSTSTVLNPTLESDILGNLTTVTPWFGAGAALGWALYVYTGSTTIDPPTFYDGIAFIQADGVAVGAVNSIEWSNAEGLFVQNQVFRGPGGAGVRFNPLNANTKDTSNFLIQDIKCTHIWQNGIKMQRVAELAPTWLVKNGVIRRAAVTYNTNVDELDKLTTETFLSGSGDGIVLNAGSDNILVTNSSVQDAFHVGISLGSDSTALNVTNNCTFEDSVVNISSWNTYGRGSCSYNGTGNKIRRCTFDGQNVRSQYAGGVTVENNIWKNCKQSSRKPGVSQWMGTESYVFDNASTLGNTVRYQQITPTDVRLINNTVQGTYFDDFIRLNSFASAFPVTPDAWVPGSVTIKNNIIIGPAATVTLRATDGGGNASVIQNPVVSKNYFYTGTTGDNKVVWKGTATPLASAPGFTLNSEANPNLDASLRPLHNSPVLRAGEHTGYKRDYFGRQRPKTPSIGAIDLAKLTV